MWWEGGDRVAYQTDGFYVLCIRDYNNLLGVHFQSCLNVVIDQRHVSDGVQGLQGYEITPVNVTSLLRACAPSFDEENAGIP